MKKEAIIYSGLLIQIKERVRQGQLRANLSANAEMLATYWDIGKMIFQQQQEKGWGKGVIPRLAKDLKNELAEVKGFSERNINNMVTFYKEYRELSILQLPVAKLDSGSISPLPVAKLEESAIWQLPVAKLENVQIQAQLLRLIGWAHHIILIQKVKDLALAC